MLNRYLVQMQSLGLLEIHHSPEKYLATQKGRKLLEKWKEIAELLCIRTEHWRMQGREMSIFG